MQLTELRDWSLTLTSKLPVNSQQLRIVVAFVQVLYRYIPVGSFPEDQKL